MTKTGHSARLLSFAPRARSLALRARGLHPGGASFMANVPVTCVLIVVHSPRPVHEASLTQD